MQLDYGIIADGFHAHPASVRIAHASRPDRLILVTDSIAAMGLSAGQYHLGTMQVTIKDGQAHITGTDTLAGAIVTMDACVQNLRQFTDCSPAAAVLAATRNPARLMGLYPKKGALQVNSDADILLLDPDTLKVRATIKSGQIVFVDGSVFPPIEGRG